MTDHPDFEALSAYHDGAAPAWDAHVAACPTCAAELARMDALAAAIREPVGDPAVPADEAVRRAIAQEAVVEEVGPVDETAPVAPQPLARARRNSVVWAAVASVAAVMVAVVGVAALLGDGDTRRPTADQALTESATTPPPGADSSAELPTAAPGDIDRAVQGGELGPVDDPEALVAQVAPALRVASMADRDNPEAAEPAPADAGGRRRVVGTRPCEYEARELDPALDDVIYVATATLEGTPVVVLGFTRRGQDPQALPPVILMAMTREGCAPVFSRPL